MHATLCKRPAHLYSPTSSQPSQACQEASDGGPGQPRVCVRQRGSGESRRLVATRLHTPAAKSTHPSRLPATHPPAASPSAKSHRAPNSQTRQVLGLLQLQLAAHKALTYRARSRLVTRTLHSELVYNLSGSKHVSNGGGDGDICSGGGGGGVRGGGRIAGGSGCCMTVCTSAPVHQCQARATHSFLPPTPPPPPQIGDSLKRFGVGDDSQHLLVARFDAAAGDVSGLTCCVLCVTATPASENQTPVIDKPRPPDRAAGLRKGPRGRHRGAPGAAARARGQGGDNKGAPRMPACLEFKLEPLHMCPSTYAA
jgi:hypothetical protein